MTDPLTWGPTTGTEASGLRWSCCGVLVAEGLHGVGCVNAPIDANVQKNRHGRGLCSCDKGMSDERLAEIEKLMGSAVPNDGLGWQSDGIHYGMLHRSEEQRWATLRVLETMFTDVPSLLAEVRRLRRENQLLMLSRGDMGAVGQD